MVRGAMDTAFGFEFNAWRVAEHTFPEIQEVSAISENGPD